MILPDWRSYLKNKLLADFFKYTLIGAIVTLMNIFFTWFLIDIVEINTVVATTAVVASLHIVKFYSYKVSKLFGRRQMGHVQFIIYTGIIAFCSILNIVLVWFLVDIIHIATVISITAVVIGLFLLRFILFKATRLMEGNETQRKQIMNMEKLTQISRNHLLFIALFILFGVIAPIYYISYPLYGDEGIFLTMGDSIKNGALLYRDVADIKPPGIFYLAALVFSVVGKSFIAVRALTFVVNIASALLILKLGAKIKDKNVGMSASIIFLVSVYLPLCHGYYYLGESFVVFFILLSVLFFLKDGHRAKFIAGLTLGLGIFFKQTAFFLFGVFFLFYLLHLRFQNNRTREYVISSTKNLILIFLGFMIPLLITFTYFFTMGAANEMLYYTIFILKDHSLPVVPYKTILSFFSYLPVWLLSLSIVLVVGYKFVKRKIVDDKHLFLVLWMIFFSIPTLVMFRFTHRFLLVIPPISMLSALFLSSLHQTLKRKRVSNQVKCFVVTTILITTAIASGTNIYLLTFGEDVDDQIKFFHEVEQYIDGEVYTFGIKNALFIFSNLTPGVAYLGTIFCTDVAEKVINDLQVNNVSYIVADRNLVNQLERGEVIYASIPNKIIYDHIKEYYQVLVANEEYIIYKLGGNTSE